MIIKSFSINYEKLFSDYKINLIYGENFHLKTEYYHLSSPAKVERHAKEILQMVEITEVTNIHYEK